MFDVYNREFVLFDVYNREFVLFDVYNREFVLFDVYNREFVLFDVLNNRIYISNEVGNDFRSQAMSLLSVVGKIGAAAAPWVARGLRNIHHTVPFYFMGGLSLVAAFLCIQLTETKGRPTVEVFLPEVDKG